MWCHWAQVIPVPASQCLRIPIPVAVTWHPHGRCCTVSAAGVPLFGFWGHLRMTCQCMENEAVEDWCGRPLRSFSFDWFTCFLENGRVALSKWFTEACRHFSTWSGGLASHTANKCLSVVLSKKQNSISRVKGTIAFTTCKLNLWKQVAVAYHD